MANYFKIVENSTTNGVGLRTSIFLSGCRLHCEGCFNKAAWSFNSGKKVDDLFYRRLGSTLDNDFTDGVTILGGEPLDELNVETTLDIVKYVRANFSNKTIWLYTGYYLMDIKETSNVVREILKHVDVVVDGPWDSKLWDVKLNYRGSSNQTIWEKNSHDEFITSDLN